MGFFKLWWLGEVSNLPQGPREAPPTPLYFGLVLPKLSGSLALGFLGDPRLCSLRHAAAARIEFSL
jgi:hypothetical protein